MKRIVSLLRLFRSLSFSLSHIGTLYLSSSRCLSRSLLFIIPFSSCSSSLALSLSLRFDYFLAFISAAFSFCKCNPFVGVYVVYFFLFNVFQSNDVSSRMETNFLFSFLRVFVWCSPSRRTAPCRVRRSPFLIASFPLALPPPPLPLALTGFSYTCICARQTVL